ncbi:MAG: hypothetical protein A2887_05525 [Alphaproteobacteria bacterium RIFCSPLOWO2_01_FULL_40_26]|nr:MAG: hypothetical protein A3D15_05980 [Alphaproteobacteria bacterium RIFCSPHIGHO2_02_FULL_40_34]OFW94192.1 MAG: hypothetical protein A2887_05525 [Alphaproteobacteria bacterium RIFCSPLOWO2_01_FULL_40_26]OFX09761.1 MAG: hypothetical protein A3H30_00285 [Alphaproteobacteria bacterium RIFCSPLOWO2_02_FULL_40_19]OFX12237.1 MAG: hypothetical protein A3G22_01835 [Alphaproteobacteria bacterium RIFCSPLOWO2_12_FULL_40_11]
MTEGEITLSEALETAKLHLEYAKPNYEQMTNFSDEDFLNRKNINIIDAFMLRYIKLQDVMGRKLFKLVLEAFGEYQGSMSMLDMLDKLEKLHLVPSADEWMDYRKKRNEPTHEYPQNRQKAIKGIKLALEHFPKVEKILLDIENYIKKLR